MEGRRTGLYRVRTAMEDGIMEVDTARDARREIYS